MKSKEKLDSFVAFCIDNPNQRFWQALKNWSRAAFIYRQEKGEWLNTAFDSSGELLKVRDTYED